MKLSVTEKIKKKNSEFVLPAFNEEALTKKAKHLKKNVGEQTKPNTTYDEASSKLSNGGIFFCRSALKKSALMIKHKYFVVLQTAKLSATLFDVLIEDDTSTLDCNKDYHQSKVSQK
jgi:hypothetical protein